MSNKTINYKLEQFRNFVSNLDNEDRNDWIRAAGKASQLWNCSNRGLGYFNEWSSTASNYEGYNDCKYHYENLCNKNSLKIQSNFKAHKFSKKQRDIFLGPYYRSIKPSMNHKYIKSKKIKPYKIRQYGEFLHIPMFNIQGELITTQMIEPNGQKLFPKGCKIKNLFLPIGKISKSKLIFCEGYATGCSIHEATNLPVIVTFNANNLRSIPKLFRKKLPRTKFYIAADDDFRIGGTANTGINAAICAVKLAGNTRILYPYSKDNRRRHQDFNDIHQRDGIEFLKKNLMEQISE